MAGQRLAVTGANGFVGRHVVGAARADGWDVVGVVRSARAAEETQAAGARPVVVPALEAAALAPIFNGCTAVVHLAQIGAESPSATFETVNVGGARRVAEAAAAAGAHRVVYLSGLGVARYGMAPRTTNRYFLSKLASEGAMFRAPLPVVVFRPSYVVGPGDGLSRSLLAQLEAGAVERPGDGRYRMQPIAVADAAAAVLAAATMPRYEDWRRHRVIDLVGPEPIAFDDFVARLAARAAAAGRPSRYELVSVPVGEADRQAREGGYKGMAADELDCMLCDEVADPEPLVKLLRRPLTPLDAAIDAAIAGA